jgi:hypothetical protein
MCQEYVEATAEYMLEFSCRLKTHLFLHLANDLFEFGPISCYNTERYEAFNSIVRCQNIYGNRHSPSKDIANNFATTENLRFVCEGGCHDNTICGKGLKELYNSPQVQLFFNGITMEELNHSKTIYIPGALRKLKRGTVQCKLLHAMCLDHSVAAAIDLKSYLSCFNINIILPNDVTMDSMVLSYGAVITQSTVMANCGDFVKKTNPEVIFGVILCIFQDQLSSKHFCLIRKIDVVVDAQQQPIVTEFDCPIVEVSFTCYVVSAHSVISPVSLIHLCNHLCTLTQHSFKHDFNNPLFCLNIYCIPQFKK